MDISCIIDGLNEAQREAVSAAPGHQLVLAGAGSGKTRVLVHRIAWLIEVEGFSLHSILAVTFTNKAAREMRLRLDNMLRVPSRQMWVGTFHGLAHRLLKLHWQEASLPEHFQILDSDDQLRLVKRAIRQLDLDESRFSPRQLQWFINAQKDEGKRARYLQKTGDYIGDKFIDVYHVYEEACERGGLVDFGELLLRSHELWLKNPALLEHYQQRFRAILVDEFQDTNTIQYAWLRMLAGTTVFVTAVGDDDQSIYGWRGAKIENIQHFSHDFPQVVTTRLEQNYRSTGTILQAANAVIEHNSGRLGKKLWTDRGEGEPISLYAAFNEQDEARFIVDRAQAFMREGHRRSEIAILYRSNAQSRVLEEALLREGVPYRIYGGQRFYERMEIKNAVAYMRLIQNRDDDAAFERVINTPTRGIGERTIEIIRDHAREHKLSLWQASNQLLERQALAARAGSTVQGFLQLVNLLDIETEELGLDELADHVIKRSGLIDFHKKEKGEKGLQRVDNLEELVSACAAFEPEHDPEHGEMTLLQEFLDKAALDAGERQAGEHEDSVQLMTLHSAKGLEFPLVFLAGMEENLFPHHMSMDDPEGLEEERRLCYVGITRAMQKLYITYAEARRLHGEETYNTPSRFIREVPRSLVQEVRLKAEINRPASYLQKTASDEDESGFSLGQRVFHHSFGEGVILAMEGSGARARVQVNFEDAGTKWLMLSHARLQAA